MISRYRGAPTSRCVQTGLRPSFSPPARPAAPEAGTLRPKRGQSFPREVQVGEREGGVCPGGVLREATVADLAEAPEALDDMKRVLDSGAHEGILPVDRPGAVRKTGMLVSSTVHAVADLHVLEGAAIYIASVGTVAVDFVLLAVESGAG